MATETDLEKVSLAYAGNDSVSYELVEGVDTNNLDSGRAAMAASLEKVGDISDYFVSRNGDGYYIVKLNAREDNKVSYTSIWVRFKWLDDEMAKLRKEGRVKEKIELKQDQGDPEDNKPEETPEDTM